MSGNLEIYTDRKIYSIPDGLNELMHDISKEVLRCQPKNVYRCISDYLINLLKFREAVRVAIPSVEQNFVDSELLANFLIKYNLTLEDAERYATKIQAAYRGYRTRKALLNIGDELVKVRVSMTEDNVIEETTDYSNPIFELLKTRGMTKEQMNSAATKIQAYFRGHRLRKKKEEKGKECLIQNIPSHESWRHDWLGEQIIKISSGQEKSLMRNSFTDFQKSFKRKNEGYRLHMETIYGGNYDDYNTVCEEQPCQESIVPTKYEAIELARPGDIDSSTSDENEIPGVEQVKKSMEIKIAEGKLVSSDDKAFFKLIDRDSLTILGKGMPATNVDEDHLPRKENSSHLSSDTMQHKKELSTTAGSVSSKSREAPELNVRPLSDVPDENKSRGSKTSDIVGKSSKESKMSLGSARSRTSVKSQAKSAKSVTDEAGSLVNKQGSRTSHLSADGHQKSATSLKSSKKSLEIKPDNISGKSESSIRSKQGSKVSGLNNNGAQKPETTMDGSQKSKDRITSSKTSIASDSKDAKRKSSKGSELSMKSADKPKLTGSKPSLRDQNEVPNETE